jgi:hypothetical protein
LLRIERKSGGKTVYQLDFMDFRKTGNHYLAYYWIGKDMQGNNFKIIWKKIQPNKNKPLKINLL